MIKRSFFGFRSPRLNYDRVAGEMSDPVQVPLPEKLVLMMPVNEDQAARVEKKKTLLKKGASVSQGQLLPLFDDSPERLLITASGTVSGLELFTGLYSRRFVSVSIDVGETEEPEAGFEGWGAKTLSLDEVQALMKSLPGRVSPNLLATEHGDFHTIVVSGADRDLSMTTNQFTLLRRFQYLNKGIAQLRKTEGIRDVVLVVPDYLKKYAEKSEARIHLIDNVYPSANKHLIARNLAWESASSGEQPDTSGYLFISAETVASLGEAVSTRHLPTDKLITVTGRDGESRLVSARVGTPMEAVVKAAGYDLSTDDHVIAGGAFTGTSVYSGELPVLYDTDAIIVEKRAEALSVTRNYCINCGNCVRSCPAKIPVNLLIRFLEAGLYEEAVEKGGLQACIECGLCGFACASKMPLFQQIKVARNELKRKKQG